MDAVPPDCMSEVLPGASAAARGEAGAPSCPCPECPGLASRTIKTTVLSNRLVGHSLPPCKIPHFPTHAPSSSPCTPVGPRTSSLSPRGFPTWLPVRGCSTPRGGTGEQLFQSFPGDDNGQPRLRITGLAKPISLMEGERKGALGTNFAPGPFHQPHRCP